MNYSNWKYDKDGYGNAEDITEAYNKYMAEVDEAMAKRLQASAATWEDYIDKKFYEWLKKHPEKAEGWFKMHPEDRKRYIL